jgi:hypothetical protein
METLFQHSTRLRCSVGHDEVLRGAVEARDVGLEGPEGVCHADVHKPEQHESGGCLLENIPRSFL